MLGTFAVKDDEAAFQVVRSITTPAGRVVSRAPGETTGRRMIVYGCCAVVAERLAADLRADEGLRLVFSEGKLVVDDAVAIVVEPVEGRVDDPVAIVVEAVERLVGEAVAVVVQAVVRIRNSEESVRGKVIAAGDAAVDVPLRIAAAQGADLIGPAIV